MPVFKPRTRVRPALAVCVVFAAVGAAMYGCGSDVPILDGSADGSADGSIDGSTDTGVLLGRDGSTTGDAANDASLACGAKGATCAASAECCSANCASHKCAAPVGACKIASSKCSSPTDCCSLSCNGGTCGATLCTSDNQACSTDAGCCSGKCAATDGGPNTCVPLNNSCKTSGNLCGGSDECCSKFCSNGVCAGQVSYCTQTNDVCSTDGQCCTGLCGKAAGAALGTCSVLSVPGGTQCVVAGQGCGAGSTDGGAPSCGGACCSRSCGPSLVSGFLTCQAPSGCHPTGEICHTENDCCGSVSSGNDRGVVCAKNSPSDPAGRCTNGNGCRANGAVCKVPTSVCSANAENNCCSGQIQNNNPATYIHCSQDLLGIPRCTSAPDCSKATPGSFAGKECSTSSDCCNFYPCVPSGQNTGTGYVCAQAQCVPVAGACSINGDCCSGNFCYLTPGSAKGQCKSTGTPPSGNDAGADGGTSNDGGGGACALYGQICNVAGDCCDGIPCISGRCRTP